MKLKCLGVKMVESRWQKQGGLLSVACIGLEFFTVNSQKNKWTPAIENE